MFKRLSRCFRLVKKSYSSKMEIRIEDTVFSLAFLREISYKNSVFEEFSAGKEIFQGVTLNEQKN